MDQLTEFGPKFSLVNFSIFLLNFGLFFGDLSKWSAPKVLQNFEIISKNGTKLRKNGKINCVTFDLFLDWASKTEKQKSVSRSHHYYLYAIA